MPPVPKKSDEKDTEKISKKSRKNPIPKPPLANEANHDIFKKLNEACAQLDVSQLDQKTYEQGLKLFLSDIFYQTYSPSGLFGPVG